MATKLTAIWRGVWHGRKQHLLIIPDPPPSRQEAERLSGGIQPVECGRSLGITTGNGQVLEADKCRQCRRKEGDYDVLN